MVSASGYGFINLTKGHTKSVQQNSFFQYLHESMKGKPENSTEIDKMAQKNQNETAFVISWSDNHQYYKIKLMHPALKNINIKILG